MCNKKPLPLIPVPTHGRCLVCGEVSYSRAGIHPQCAVRQADASRMERIKKARQARLESKPASAAKRWQRACPSCQTLQHVRTRTCVCGHVFRTPSKGETEIA